VEPYAPEGVKWDLKKNHIIFLLISNHMLHTCERTMSIYNQEISGKISLYAMFDGMERGAPMDVIHGAMIPIQDQSINQSCCISSFNWVALV
jgi:hypothetical protein